MTASDQDLDGLIKRLHLANTRRAWRELTRRAEQEEWCYRDFLALLISEEVAHRQQTRLTRLVRRARFPFLKTIDDFNFMYQSTVRLSLLGSALAPDFVTEGRCIIFGGQTGRGKTHLAVAIAYRAIQNGFDARCVTAADSLMTSLAPSAAAGSPRRWRPTSIPACSWSMKWAISRTGRTRRICCSTSSTIGIGRSARWYSPPIKRSRHGAVSCTTTTWPMPSSIGSSSAADWSCSMGPRCGPNTSDLTNRPRLRHQINRPEFPESMRQNFRNPHRLHGTVWPCCSERSRVDTRVARQGFASSASKSGD